MKIVSFAVNKLLFSQTSDLLWNSWTHFRQVNDSEEMSQMNVFQKLGHAYIPIGYIRLTSWNSCAAWWNKFGETEWHVRHESAWRNTNSTLHARLVIQYDTLFIL
jgi:hypothetical protein